MDTSDSLCCPESPWAVPHRLMLSHSCFCTLSLSQALPSLRPVPISRCHVAFTAALQLLTHHLWVSKGTL